MDDSRILFCRYFEGTFAKECGDDEVCKSDLNVIASLGLEYNETLKHHLLRLGEQDTVPLVVEVTNSKEPAYETLLIITHDKALIFDPTESEVNYFSHLKLAKLKFDIPYL